MLCRVANAIFWMSRYIERAENTARFIDVNQGLSLGFHQDFETQWEPLVYTTGEEELYKELYDDFTQQNVIRFLTFNEENPNSILSCLKQARLNAREIRGNLSTVIWEEINRFYLMVQEASQQGVLVLNKPFEFLDRVKRRSHLVIGATQVTMSHGEAWNLARLGRLLERADNTSRILDVKYYILLPDINAVGTPLDVVQWSALLNSNSALQMYRRQHGRIIPDKVADFLILDRYFPRSIHFCLINASQSLGHITGSEPGLFRLKSEKLLGRLRAEMDYMSIEDVIDRGMHEFIDDVQIRLNEIGGAISDDFFKVD